MDFDETLKNILLGLVLLIFPYSFLALAGFTYAEIGRIGATTLVGVLLSWAAWRAGRLSWREWRRFRFRQTLRQTTRRARRVVGDLAGREPDHPACEAWLAALNRADSWIHREPSFVDLAADSGRYDFSKLIEPAMRRVGRRRRARWKAGGGPPCEGTEQTEANLTLEAVFAAITVIRALATEPEPQTWREARTNLSTHGWALGSLRVLATKPEFAGFWNEGSEWSRAEGSTASVGAILDQLLPADVDADAVLAYDRFLAEAWDRRHDPAE